MVLHIDLQTVYCMLAGMNLLLSATLLYLHLSMARRVEGMQQWAGSAFLLFLAFAAYTGRGILPDSVSIVAGNVLLLGGLASYYFGCQRYHQLQPAYYRWLGAILALVPLLAWFTFVEANFRLRVAALLLVWAVFAAAQLRLFLRQELKAVSTRFMLALTLVQVFTIAVRLASLGFMTDSTGLLDGTPFENLYIAASSLCIVMGLGVGILIMISERLRSDLEQLARRDALTGLLARAPLLDACSLELSRGQRHQRSISVLMLDIDHFRTVNETYGHQIGDQVLVDFANRVSSLLRPSDQFGRFGGEEFLLVLPETAQSEALVVAERVRQTAATAGPDTPPVTVSIGVATMGPATRTVDALLRQSDKALLRAKAAGCNCVRN
jgi:diguanylate cyclase (GGDEF)-like protein